jgi:hypothetical protein
MLAPLLNALTFRSNNERHRPVIEALTLLKRYSLYRNADNSRDIC